MKIKNGWIKDLLIQLLLILTASALFALSFPNPLFENGFPLFAWFAYIPALAVIQKNSLIPCIGWGAVYGFFSYSLFNYWLMSFHPLAGTVVYSVYLVYMAVVFLFLKLAALLYPKHYYLVQWIIWLAYEYLRSLGFIGYTYGITGYSQWRVIPLIQIASITGVWGVSALVTFPSFFIAGALKNLYFGNASLKQYAGTAGTAVKDFIKKEKIPAVIFTVLLAASLVFGVIKDNDFTKYGKNALPSAQIALVQNNTDPWEASNAESSWQIYETFRSDLAVLKKLSNEALAAEPKTQLVVWAETAFVPRIYWHANYRDDQDSWHIVRELLEYLSEKNIPFLIGNDDARMEPEKNPNESEKYRVDYNAALLFEKGQITEIYRKIHLVPFTEYFPYRKQFPSIYNALKSANTHFWEKGEHETVFSISGFSFSAPICFEDTFGYISRNFVRGGADILINLTNDAWAKSLCAQNQHLSIAIFRAVENYRPMVRSTVSGQTCAIEPTGRITAIAPPFKQTWINVTVPIVKKNTIYTLYGDYLGIAFLTAAIILLLSRSVWYTIERYKRG